MISVDDEMFQAIEDFRFENRFQTRSEATAELIRLGLETLNKDSKKDTLIEQEKSTALQQKPSEEKSTDELEQKYITKKHLKPVSKITKLNVSNSTVDTQSLKNKDTNNKVSNH